MDNCLFSPLRRDIDLRLGDCREVLRSLPDNSIDSVVTDPPYALVSVVKRFGGKNAAAAKSEGATGVYKRASAGFMGQTWDTGETAFSEEFWAEVLRVLKPGGHVVAFSGTRTYHRMAVAIEDAGFEIRDQIQWLYGSGFPKSHDVSKGIDKKLGVEREVIGRTMGAGTKDPTSFGNGHKSEYDITAPATPEAQQWEGWGTALKPANEPICLARKPLDGTVAENVLKWGTGAINIDGCRIGDEVRVNAPAGNKSGGNSLMMSKTGMPQDAESRTATGRWPANVITDGSVEMPSSAQRFFYSAKASKADRGNGNNHPTVKPTDLMRYLCKLVTPPGGTVLDPFMGSGSTGKAAALDGYRFVGIEREVEFFEIAKERCKCITL